jgi:hemerythrin-like metal-binding protein
MAFLSWHERYSVGHAELDAEHKRLFELVNHFDDVIQMELAGELGLILDDIVSSTVAHFRREEDLMKQAGFPRLAEHKDMHHELINQIMEERAKMKKGGHVGTKSVVRFLADWLTNHIIREDMEYKPYLKG